MSDEQPAPEVGAIVWHDLTVADAAPVRDFYAAVVGWSYESLDMGGYSDYVMMPKGSTDGVAGICYARGANTNLPAQWLIYIRVHDVDRSAQLCVEQGGAVLHGPREVDGGRFCVIRDPAGAVAGLYAPAAS